ncbi:MAG: hypothetical protein IK079_04700, partial [Desulfovibrio sp.]|nr:hypothetical protein [Desulfovibrio sp.]
EGKDLLGLDTLFRQTLEIKTKRHFNFSKNHIRPTNTSYHNASQPQALEDWVLYGKNNKADLLLVPFVLDWHERAGSKVGVTQSAHVHLQFFLIKVNTGQILQRSIYEEKQQALSENFLKINDFIRRKGSWVQATDLALEGMQKAIKDLGL